jgi:hypothetical protein
MIGVPKDTTFAGYRGGYPANGTAYTNYYRSSKNHGSHGEIDAATFTHEGVWVISLEHLEGLLNNEEVNVLCSTEKSPFCSPSIHANSNLQIEDRLSRVGRGNYLYLLKIRRLIIRGLSLHPKDGIPSPGKQQYYEN